MSTSPASSPLDERWLGRVADISSEARDTNELMERLLAAITEFTGLESAFVTRLDWEAGRMTILATRNERDVLIPRDMDIPLEDSLCLRSLRDERFWTSDVHDQWQDLDGLHPGIETYVSVPILLPGDDDEPYAMLCAASSDQHPADERIRPVLLLLSQLIAGKLASDRERVLAVDRAETAESLLRERLEFAAMTEHAMKGPLTVVEGWLAMLGEQGESMGRDDRERAYDAMRRATDRMAMQLEDLVTEARSTLLQQEPREQSLDDIARAVVADFDGHVPSFVFVGSPASAVVDRRGVELVLEHLLENVLSHAPEGTAVEVDTREEGLTSVLEVRDRGPGVPPTLDVFAPFTSGGGGSGLGLWIVRSLVETMRGAVSTTPTSPHGLTVTCRFPTRDPLAS